jgi:hypothetical protein
MPREVEPVLGTGRSVVVCGSRDWPAPWLVTAKLIELVPRDWLVITSGARGVDRHAHIEAVRLGYATKVMPAEWDRHGKRAGYLRNVAMLDEGPSKVLAFHAHQSKGTAHTIREASRRGIELHVFTEAELRGTRQRPRADRRWRAREHITKRAPSVPRTRARRRAHGVRPVGLCANGAGNAQAGAARR